MKLTQVTNNQYLNFLSRLNGSYSFKVTKVKDRVDGFDKDGKLVSRRNIGEVSTNGVFDDTYEVREDHLGLCVE